MIDILAVAASLNMSCVESNFWRYQTNAHSEKDYQPSSASRKPHST